MKSYKEYIKEGANFQDPSELQDLKLGEEIVLDGKPALSLDGGAIIKRDRSFVRIEKFDKKHNSEENVFLTMKEMEAIVKWFNKIK